MSFDVIEYTLSAAVATSGTFAVSYPAGRSAGNYSGGHKHKLMAMNAQFSAPNDFTLTFGASSVTVTYLRTTTIPAGSRVVLQLDRFGTDSKIPNSVVLPDNIIKASTFLIDLGSPDTADADGICASQGFDDDPGALINGAYAEDGVAYLDVPRNVVAAWTTTAVLTITGTDQFGAPLVEVSASGTSHTGKKAFKTITSITASTAITSATVGTGDVLGLPTFIPNASWIMGELKDGALLGRRPGVVYITSHELEAAVDAGTSLWVTSPVAGNIRKLTVTNRDVVTTGGAITVEVNTVAVDGLSVTLVGAAAGDTVSDTATPGHATTVVAVGDEIEIIPASAINASSDLYYVLEIDTTPAGMLDGTLVAAVASAGTGTTGDVRGTYDPTTACDGATAFALLAVLPDPGNRGVAQYAG